MSKGVMWAAAGMLAFGFGTAYAQQDAKQPTMTLEGAQAAVTEIQGMNRCLDPGDAPSASAVPDVDAVSKEQFEADLKPYTTFINTANAYVECIRAVEEASRGLLTDVQSQAIVIVDQATWEKMDALVPVVQPAITAYKAKYPNG